MDVIKPNICAWGSCCSKCLLKLGTDVFHLIVGLITFRSAFFIAINKSNTCCSKLPRISVTSVPRDWLPVGRITMRPLYQMCSSKQEVSGSKTLRVISSRGGNRTRENTSRTCNLDKFSAGVFYCGCVANVMALYCQSGRREVECGTK